MRLWCQAVIFSPLKKFFFVPECQAGSENCPSSNPDSSHYDSSHPADLKCKSGKSCKSFVGCAAQVSQFFPLENSQSFDNKKIN